MSKKPLGFIPTPSALRTGRGKLFKCIICAFLCLQSLSILIQIASIQFTMYSMMGFGIFHKSLVDSIFCYSVNPVVFLVLSKTTSVGRSPFTLFSVSIVGFKSF